MYFYCCTHTELNTNQIHSVQYNIQKLMHAFNTECLEMTLFGLLTVTTITVQNKFSNMSFTK